MKNTIKNTVQEIYGSAVENASTHFSPSLATNSGGVNVISKMIPDSIPEVPELITKTDNKFVYIVAFVVLCLFAIGWYFKDKIIDYIQDFINRFQDDKSDVVEDEKEVEDKPKKVAEVVDENDTVKDKKEVKDKKSVKEPPLSQQYSQSQIVGEEVGYCYLGTDNNMRECTEVYNGEVCTSGDIYKRVDECLIAKNEK